MMGAQFMHARRALRWNPDLFTGLAAYWRLEEASGNRLDVLGNYPLTPVNTPGNAAGINKNGLSVVSASAQSLTGTVSPGAQSKLSLSLWVNRSATSRSMTMGWISATGSNNCGIVVWTDGNTYVSCDNGVSPSYASVADSLTGWHHYVFVYDGGQAGNARGKLYVDGAAASLSSFFTTPPATYTPNGPYTIGQSATNGSLDWGTFDEAAMWLGVALTATQALKLFNAGRSLPLPFIG